MADFDVYKSFYLEEQALQFKKLLDENGFETKLEKKRAIADKVLVGDGAEPEIYLMLKGEDFNQADNVINRYITNNIGIIDPDYYLHSFADDELFEIIQKTDEWNNQDVMIAYKLLNERGYNINYADQQGLKKTRKEVLAQPEDETAPVAMLGYVLAAFIPVFGIFFAIVKLTAKKVLPDGSKVPIYNKEAKMHYVMMILIGIALLVLLFVFGVVERSFKF